LVFIPEALLADWTSMKMALHHELQHIRSGDLSWAWLPEVARAVAGWNPFVRYWMDRIEEQDELACDEALLGRRGFDHRAYATCLYEVARAATQTERIARPSGTVGMAVAPNFLKRRIEMSLQEMRPTSNWSGRILVAALTTVTAFSAWAGKGLISDRRITERAAQEYAKKAQASSEIPIVVNEQVLHWLNQTTATSRKRFWMRNALKRMRTFEPMIRAKLAAAQLPAELMAVPLIETGYQNTETTTAAGIWSFVPQTARNFGLEVSDERDERMDPVKETEAAVRYYLSLQKRFSDWNLSLLSYNAGESQVEKWVLTSGIRDVYRLADEGVITNQENKNYVPKLMAALIIMKNPDLVRD
jgi:soluble lytic murein transglycosylase-like protein